MNYINNTIPIAGKEIRFVDSVSNASIPVDVDYLSGSIHRYSEIYTVKIPTGSPVCPMPMTRAALMTLRASNGLSRDCTYVITDHVQGRLVAGTTILLRAASSNELYSEVAVNTTYSDNAWFGLYDIDNGIVYELHDEQENIVRMLDGTAISEFDWGNINIRNSYIEESNWICDYGSTSNIRNLKLTNGSYLDTTNNTGLISDLWINNSTVYINNNTSGFSVYNTKLNRYSSLFIVNNDWVNVSDSNIDFSSSILIDSSVSVVFYNVAIKNNALIELQNCTNSTVDASSANDGQVRASNVELLGIHWSSFDNGTRVSLDDCNVVWLESSLFRAVLADIHDYVAGSSININNCEFISHNMNLSGFNSQSSSYVNISNTRIFSSDMDVYGDVEITITDSKFEEKVYFRMQGSTNGAKLELNRVLALNFVSLRFYGNDFSDMHISNMRISSSDLEFISDEINITAEYVTIDNESMFDINDKTNATINRVDLINNSTIQLTTGSGGNVSLYDVEVSNTSSIGLWQFGGTGLLNIYDAKISNASNLFVTDESWGIVLSNIIINNQGELNISNTYNAASDINIRNININSDSNFTIYNSALTTYGTSTIENVSLDTGSSLQIMDATNNMDIRYINCATHGVLSVISSAISTNNVSLINSEVTQSDGSIDTLFASMNSLLNINHSVTECYYNYPGSFTTSGININKGRDYFNNTWV